MRERVAMLEKEFREAGKQYKAGQITHKQYDDIAEALMLARKIRELNLPKKILQCFYCEEVFIVINPLFESSHICDSCVDALERGEEEL